jgi:hypothetical protein
VTSRRALLKRAVAKLSSGVRNDYRRGRLICMNIAWHDLNQVSKAGRYPFRDGTIEVLEIEIAYWKENPAALFRLMRKNPIREGIVYVLGEIVGPLKV